MKVNEGSKGVYVPYLNRGNAKIYYEVEGDGPLIVLSHGYGASARMWDDQMPALKSHYKVLRWEIRGHSRTETEDDVRAYSFDQAVGDMAALMDAVGEQQAVMSGFSLGGYLSLRFRAAHPDRVKALVLTGTGPGYRKAEPREQWNQDAELWAKRFEDLGLNLLEGEEISREMKQATHPSATGLVHAARGLFPQHDSLVIDSLPEIDVPTLVFVGEDDTPFRTSCAYMASKVPSGRLVVVPEANHAANMDNPKVYNPELLSFLDEVHAPKS